MSNYKLVSALVECGVKLLKHDNKERVNQTFFKSLVGSLRQLICTRPNILFGTGLLSCNIEVPTMTHLKTTKRILRYIKDTLDFGLLHSPSKEFKLVGYNNNDQARDIDDRKSDSRFVFYMDDIAFAWTSKKQPIVTVCCYYLQYLSCNWLRNLLKELQMLQAKAMWIFVDNKLTLALVKNLVFHDQSQHMDTQYHFI